MNEFSKLQNFSRVSKNYSIWSGAAKLLKKPMSNFRKVIRSVIDSPKVDRGFIASLEDFVPENQLAKSLGYTYRARDLAKFAENYAAAISKASKEEKALLDELTKNLPSRLRKAEFNIPAFKHDGEHLVREGDSFIKKIISKNDAGEGFMVHPRIVFFDEMIKRVGTKEAERLDKLLYPGEQNIKSLFSLKMERGIANLPETFSKVVKQHFPDVTKYCGF